MRRTTRKTAPLALESLPQVGSEVWEGGAGVLTAEVQAGTQGAPFHPELAMWVVAGEEYILGHTVTDPGAGEDALVALLPEVMRRPAVGKPRRPAKVRVQDPVTARRLEELLGPLGVVVEQHGELFEWQAAFDEANAATVPPEEYRPSSPGHAEALAELFRAAAAFFRAAPWRHLGDGRPIGLDLPGASGSTLGLTVMGAGGENRGLVVYPSLQDILEFSMTAARVDPAALDLADLPPAVSLNFSTAEEMPADAIEEAQARGWELAAPDAYPLMLATEPGEGCFLDLSPETILLMTIALRAVTAFCIDAEADLRASRPAIARELQIEIAGELLPVGVSSPPSFSGPVRRPRKPARGPRGRKP